MRQKRAEKPTAKLIGANVNIYNLMSIAGKVLKKSDQYEEAAAMYKRITETAKSYDEALLIIQEYVDME